ncbi:STAS domain-containing protein [Caldicellulosiruptoraceae bacterium PP1]
MNLELKELTENNDVIIQLKGEIDIFSSPALKEKLYEVIDASSKDISINMKEVTYIDSTGLGVFVGALKKAKQKDINIILKDMKPNVKKIFKITGLDKVFPVE